MQAAQGTATTLASFLESPDRNGRNFFYSCCAFFLKTLYFKKRSTTFCYNCWPCVQHKHFSMLFMFAMRCVIFLQSQRNLEWHHFQILNSFCFPLMTVNSRMSSLPTAPVFYQSRVAFFTPKKENSKKETFYCTVGDKKTADWVSLNDLELTWNFPFLVLLVAFFQRLFTRGKCETNQNSNEKNTREKWGHRSKWPLQKMVISPQSAPGRPQLPLERGKCAPLIHLISWAVDSASQNQSHIEGPGSEVRDHMLKD